MRLHTTLRVQVQNVTNVYVRCVGDSPGFLQSPDRTTVPYLILDE
jgi:hypothetical protein